MRIFYGKEEDEKAITLVFFDGVWYNDNMKVYAISDLHLSGMADKPMDVFGPGWEGHFEKIKADWESKVSDEDIVLIGGDTSWGMYPEEGMYDVRTLAPLKGRKVFIRGNHDYWWNGITKLRSRAPDDSFVFLQTDAVRIGEYVVVGSRGWSCPGSPDYSEQDRKLYIREAERFRLAFGCASALKREGDKLIAMIHYPPFNLRREDSLFTELFEKNKADKVIFGHLHGPTFFPLYTAKNGVDYYLTSCDKTDFKLIKIY